MEDLIIVVLSRPLTVLFGLAMGGLMLWLSGGNLLLTVCAIAAGGCAGLMLDARLRGMLQSLGRRIPRVVWAALGFALAAMVIFLAFHRKH